MPTYRANCVSQSGEFFTKDFEAPNVPALRAAIEARGAFLLIQRETATPARVYRTRLPLAVLVQLFDLMAMQLGSGVSAEIAVAKLKDEFPDKGARNVLRGVHADLASSTASLSGAFAKYSRSFPDGVVAAMRIGEESGGKALAARFEDLRDQIAFRIAIRKTAAKALAYPLFILCFASCVIGLLMVKLVPNIKLLLASLNVPLPGITRLVLALSETIGLRWPWLLAVSACIFAGLRLLRAIPVLASARDWLLLRLPWVRGIFQSLITAEVAKNYRVLYLAGADAGSTLAACAGVVRNSALKTALLRSRTLLESGIVTAGASEAQAITEALRATGYFPELALTIIGTGEMSGSLAKALDSVAAHYAGKAHERILAFFAVFDKAVMLALIGAVGVIIVGMWMPIMTAAENIHR